MDTKKRNIVKWYKSYVGKKDKTSQEVINTIPYSFVKFKTPIVYFAKNSVIERERLSSIKQWLRSNVNGDRYVMSILDTTKKQAPFAIYDNRLYGEGFIFGIAFQEENDAVLFKLSCNELL